MGAEATFNRQRQRSADSWPVGPEPQPGAVHMERFAPWAGLTAPQIRSLTHGTGADVCEETERDRLLIEAADQLPAHHDIDDTLWGRLVTGFTPEQPLDPQMLCGWYHGISHTARATGLPVQPGAGGVPRLSAADGDDGWPEALREVSRSAARLARPAGWACLCSLVLPTAPTAPC